MRTIPFAALHDGERFLIDRYAVATTPGLDLIEPRPLDRTRLKALVTGISEGVQGFAPLAYVREEVSAVGKLYEGDVLLDGDFLRARLEDEMRDQSLSVVHIASHGSFGGDVDDTFLLTYDGKLSMQDLDRAVGLFRFRDRPLELLTLSACETAAGDDRAALGLAGIAVKAGARSVLATLWTVSDRAAATLVEDFYRELQEDGVARAVALQRAQRAMLEDPSWRHPAYWSAFILISSWL
jgi:CHAT domain-containing protein